MKTWLIGSVLLLCGASASMMAQAEEAFLSVQQDQDILTQSILETQQLNRQMLHLELQQDVSNQIKQSLERSAASARATPEPMEWVAEQRTPGTPEKTVAL